MRLFPPELEIGPEEGFTPEKDLFDRRPFGGKLTRIIQTADSGDVAQSFRDHVARCSDMMSPAWGVLLAGCFGEK